MLHFIITLFNVGNVLFCVIYKLNFTVFIHVTQMSHYVTLYIAFGLGTYYPRTQGSACVRFVTVIFILLWEGLIALQRNFGLENNRRLETIQSKYVYHGNALIILVFCYKWLACRQRGRQPVFGKHIRNM